MNNGTPCRCCGKPMHRWTQPAWQVIPAKDYEECTNPDCDMLGVTLLVGDHAQLTDSQIDAYAVSVRNYKAERARA